MGYGIHLIVCFCSLAEAVCEVSTSLGFLLETKGNVILARRGAEQEVAMGKKCWHQWAGSWARTATFIGLAIVAVPTLLAASVQSTSAVGNLAPLSSVPVPQPVGG